MRIGPENCQSLPRASSPAPAPAGRVRSLGRGERCEPRASDEGPSLPGGPPRSARWTVAAGASAARPDVYRHQASAGGREHRSPRSSPKPRHLSAIGCEKAWTPGRADPARVRDDREAALGRGHPAPGRPRRGARAPAPRGVSGRRAAEDEPRGQVTTTCPPPLIGLTAACAGVDREASGRGPWRRFADRGQSPRSGPRPGRPRSRSLAHFLFFRPRGRAGASVHGHDGGA